MNKQNVELCIPGLLLMCVSRVSLELVHLKLTQTLTQCGFLKRGHVDDLLTAHLTFIILFPSPGTISKEQLAIKALEISFCPFLGFYLHRFSSYILKIQISVLGHEMWEKKKKNYLIHFFNAQ